MACLKYSALYVAQDLKVILPYKESPRALVTCLLLPLATMLVFWLM